jgi:hypothetical protein
LLHIHTCGMPHTHAFLHFPAVTPTSALPRSTVTTVTAHQDGLTYERLAIERWLENHDTSPLTGERLAHKGLTPNVMVRALCRDVVERE